MQKIELKRNHIYQGNCLDVLKTFPDESVDCVVTSPPYFNQRNYGTTKWEGGDSECDHLAAKMKSRYDYSLENSPIQNKKGDRVGTDAPKYKPICPTCGAKRVDEQIGLEESPSEFIGKLVDVFREVRRVLKKTGTCWLNIGDSYMSPGIKDDKIKPTEICAIPFKLAIALSEDGWFLRQEIIWSKQAFMPESCTNRCTKSHEYIFLLTKSQKYYYDYIAIREPVTLSSLKRAEYGWNCDRDFTKNASMGGEGIHTERMGERFVNPDGRNKRSVWTCNTANFAEAHFASFSQELINPMILAGSSEKGVCPKCGKPFIRIIEKGEVVEQRKPENGKLKIDGQNGLRNGYVRHEINTKRWQASCECHEKPIPALVLDPFMGAGTVAIESLNQRREYVGIELNPEYIEMSNRRIKKFKKDNYFVDDKKVFTPSLF